jgi:hypothetical protein
MLKRWLGALMSGDDVDVDSERCACTVVVMAERTVVACVDELTT